MCYSSAADTAPRCVPMAKEAGEAPGRLSSCFSTAGSDVWESSQATMHAPFPSWSTHAAGAADSALASQPWAAAADSRVPSHRVPGDAWIQSVPGGGGMHGFLSLLEARNVTPEMFDDVPAADDYPTGSGAASNMAGSVAATGYGLAGVDGRYTVASPIKPETAASQLTCSEDRAVQGNMGSMACYDHELERDNRQREFGAASVASFLQEMIPCRVEKQSGLGYSAIVGAERLMESYAGSSSLSDYRSTGEFVSNNRQQQDITPEMASGSSGNGSTRRKSEERAGGSSKKSKKEASKTSPPMPQASNVKLGEKITALQQIVSPFGKTDRASVLLETTKYIEFLHEQIQLFSEPYMTKSAHKGRIQFGVGEEKAGTQHSLRRSGLCLIPVSWTSQVYRDFSDDTLPDCWTPAYRSCLYQ